MVNADVVGGGDGGFEASCGLAVDGDAAEVKHLAQGLSFGGGEPGEEGNEEEHEDAFPR